MWRCVSRLCACYAPLSTACRSGGIAEAAAATNSPPWPSNSPPFALEAATEDGNCHKACSPLRTPIKAASRTLPRVSCRVSFTPSVPNVAI